MKFGKPTMRLDLLNWYDSGWGGAYFGDEYLFYEDIYPRLTGYLATLHSDEGLEDYIEFKVSAKARDIGSGTSWDELDWVDLGDEDIFISSLKYDGLYYFEYPFGQDGDMLMGKEIQLNITADCTYNQTGMIQDNREQKLYILNMSIITSTIRNDTDVLQSYSNSDPRPYIWIGSETDGYGVERYFEYDTEINNYGIDADDVMLDLNGYNSIKVVEVRVQDEYKEIPLNPSAYDVDDDGYTVILLGDHEYDNHSDLVISYSINVDANKVMEWTFSESQGFIHSVVIFRSGLDPIELSHNLYLGKFYSKFNETYTLASNKAVLNIGFTDITIDHVRIYNITDTSGQEITEPYNLNEVNDDKQIEIEIQSTTGDVVIEYGIASYKLDRGYQWIGYNMTDSVRKLSKFHGSHALYNYSTGASPLNLLEIPDDPQDPFESNSPKIIIPLLEDEKTTITFNYLALMYDTVLNGTFYLDDCVLARGINKLRPILATFTFTTESGESYFDYVTIDSSSGEQEFDFEINLQPIYAVEGYTTFDIDIDFLSYGDNLYTLQYILFDTFELTSDDRILQISDKSMLDENGELNAGIIINTAHYAQIFTDNLYDAYGIIDDSWLTLSVEGFNGFADLVNLYRNEQEEIVFGDVLNNEHYFQSLEDDDRRLVDSMGLHLNAYDLELPEYFEGEVNLYAGKGTYTYGEVYEEKEYSMGWNNDFEIDVNSFDHNTFNSQFELSSLPLTTQYMYVVGELYLHHRIDISNPSNIIKSGLPANVEFAIIIPSSTSRIGSVDVSYIDRVSRPWDWVESWQGFALTEADYHLYNPDNAGSYNPSHFKLASTQYELIINDNEEYQINFFETEDSVVSLLGSDTIQIDFHTDYEFAGFDYEIYEDGNTYNSELHWTFPGDSYMYWDQFEYHPDMTSGASFNASFYHLSEYASMEDWKSSTVEEFQFYPNEYNFTEFTFTGFDDEQYEVTLDLTDGGDFQYIIDDELWYLIKPFGMTVQTESGERYLDRYSFSSWQHAGGNEPIYTFYLRKQSYDWLNILEDTEVLVTYYYPKESLSYYTKYDDVLYDAETFIIKDSLGEVILHLGNISSIEGNNITFTENIKSILSIGDKFTVEYEFKTKGGLLDTKHFFVEVQPYEMSFYNNFYPFSGGSIVAPLYYNFSSNYQYQLALNYRLLEKGIYSFEFDIEAGEGVDEYTHDLSGNVPIREFDDTPVVIAHFYNDDQKKCEIAEKDLLYNFEDNELNVNLSEYKDKGLGDGRTLFVSIFSELHNKYQHYHNLIVNLTNNEIILANWTMTQAPEDNLIANFESLSFIYNFDLNRTISKGMVKQIYAILNSTNSLTYYLTEDLNDPSGWSDYDTLIMKVGFLNLDVLDFINVSFYYGVNTFIGSTKISLDMIDTDSGAVYIKLPDEDFSQFTVQNNAHIIFTPVFYDSSDFEGFFYEQGFPYFQTVQWDVEDVVNGMISVDLEREIFSLSEEVYVFNEQFELVYIITDIDERTEEYTLYNNRDVYEVEFNNISLPATYIDQNGNTMTMRDGELLFLKYNAVLNESIALMIEDMVIQKAPYIEDPVEPVFVPFAEISLLGIYNDGESYIYDDLFENRDKLVVWETPLDLTPFESEFFNTYRQLVINISFEDIYSDFKVSEGSIDYSYITDVLVTSNDPRYQIVIDSIFLFEFDENATLYDSEIFDIYEHNHIESFYFGNYTDIFSEYIILNASDFLPIYHDNANINETYYFDAFDNIGNWYYFDSHLFGESISSGIYNITWNPFYSKEYYCRYYDTETTAEELSELYDYYNPHIDKFRYLYISWADDNAWEEWHTIESVNVNVSSFEVIFEWYNETLEEYQSVSYDQSLGEFEARNIAVETFYPYDKNMQTANFTLSQDYGSAQDLDIYAIEGMFFNESSHDFDPDDVNIYASENLIEISAPNGFNLDDFETILLYLNFTEGAYSDYIQFRLLDDAITNHPEAPTWTTNDSLYIDFEYNDIDYFLLVEDYMVGSEDSSFEYLDYTRNARFVDYLEVPSVYEVDKSTQPQTFDNFTKVNDYSSTLELHDFDMDCEHEIVIQKDDITRDGVYDSLKYGYVNPAGEITFHTLLQQATSTQIYTDKNKETKIGEGYQLDWKDITRKYYIYVRREITTETLITNRIDTYGILIQKDLDGDGNADKEVMFDTIYTTTTVDTLTKEVTHFRWKPTVNNPTGRSHRGQLTEWRNSTTVYYDGVFSFTFKDFDGLEASSIRYYEDLYPNELSQVYNLDNYLVTITNDNNDDDPSNDVVIEAPNLEALLSISDSYDGVPAMFDHRTTVEDGEVTHENLLATTKTITIPDGYKAVSGVVDDISTEAITVDVIEVIPEDGVYFDSSWIYSYGSGRTEGYYYYFDENGDGVFSTIFILDSTDTLIGIGFDYDANTYFEPGKRQVVERHIICGKPSGWKKTKYNQYTGELSHYYVAMSNADDKLVHFQDTDHYDGVFFEVSFGDAMFDIWKMEYSYGTSRLIEETQYLTADRFAESLGSRKWDDVMEQVETQLMALLIS